MSYTRRELLQSALAAFVLPRFKWTWPHSGAPDVPRAAERWISRSRIQALQGVTWPADPLKPDAIDRTLYNGTPGIVLFLVELHAATGEQRFLDEARLGAEDLAASIGTHGDAGLYTGLAGVAFILSRVPGYETAAKRALDRVREMPLSESTDIISGSAGIGLTYLSFDDVANARKHGERLLEIGQSEHGGVKWAVAPTVRTLYPNFSHGTSGVAYFLATLYARDKDKRFLEAARAGVRYLDAVAVRQANGYTVFHHEPDGTNLFYLSWCHGPVGTARLFYRLHRVTGEKQWMERVHQCARGITNAGVPEVRSPGYWNNISQCCGDAGVGEFFVELQRIAPSRDYESMVARCEARLLREATTEGDGMKWVQAEHRVRPELLIAQTGLMQGAAGVGLFFLHADAMRRGRQPFVRLPDSPYGA